MQSVTGRIRITLLLAFALILAACGSASPPAATAPKAPAASAPAAKPAAPSASAPAAPAAPAKASEPVKLTKPVNVRMAAGPPGGGWYAYAASFTEVLRKALPAGSAIDAMPKALGIGNVQLLQTGQAEIGLLFTLTADWAAGGKAAFDGKPQTKVASLIGGLDTYYGGFMLPAKLNFSVLQEMAAKKTPIKLVTQNMGSLSEWFTRAVVGYYGMNYDKIKAQGGSVTASDLNVISQLARDGKADAIGTVFNPGHQTFTEIALTTDYRFVELPDDLVAHLAKGQGYSAGTMPPKIFPKQDKAVKEVQLMTTLAASTDVPDDVAYTITKSIVEAMPTLQKTYSSMSVFKAENAWKPENNGIKLHPGAARYYREKGWMK